MSLTATESVWQRLSADLRRFIARRVHDAHDADDLLQEVFLRIHRKIGELRDADRLAAWVYQIARNVIGDHYRRQSREGGSLADFDLPDEEEERDRIRVAAGQWLGELIEHLPPAYRDAVQLAEIEGLSQREVAQRLGLTLPAAKSRIQRGRAMLKELLDECCTFQFDRRGNLTDCDPKSDRTVCRNCDELELPLAAPAPPGE